MSAGAGTGVPIGGDAQQVWTACPIPLRPAVPGPPAAGEGARPRHEGVSRLSAGTDFSGRAGEISDFLIKGG